MNNYGITFSAVIMLFMTSGCYRRATCAFEGCPHPDRVTVFGSSEKNTTPDANDTLSNDSAPKSSDSTAPAPDNSAKIDELNSQIAAQDQKIRDMSASYDQLSNRINSMENRTSGVETSQRSETSKIEQLDQNIRQNQTATEENKKQIEEIKKAIADDIAGLQNSINTVGAALEEQDLNQAIFLDGLKALMSRLKDIEAYNVALYQWASETTKTISDLVSEIYGPSGLRDRISSLEETLATNKELADSEISDIKSDIEDLKTNIPVMIDMANQSLKVLMEDKISDISEKVENMEGEVAASCKKADDDTHTFVVAQRYHSVKHRIVLNYVDVICNNNLYKVVVP
ncbi:MAG: hypothetical protein HQK54_12325 [Oligoflexales bacterium]|nr:hypothetical protein [Oligoflexales bacterium]